MTAIRIATYSTISSSESADVAIVLGAAVWDSQPSPVFEERIKHGIHLYQSGQVSHLIFTGGVGEGDTLSESEVAKRFAIERGVSEKSISIESESRITHENLVEACRLMQESGSQSALIVSDPFHMFRATRIAKSIGLEAYPSPTPTSRYQSWRSKTGQLLYEVVFLTIHYVSNTIGLIERC